MQTLNPGDTETVHRIVSELKGRPGPLLEILHAVQTALRHIPAAVVPLVAEGLKHPSLLGPAGRLAGDRDHCP